MPRPSSSLSAAAEASEPSGSDAPSLPSSSLTTPEPEADEQLAELSERGDAVAVAAGDGLLPRPSSSLSAAAEATEPSGSDTASHGDDFSDTVAVMGGLALGEGSASLDDIAAGPRKSQALEPKGRLRRRMVRMKTVTTMLMIVMMSVVMI